MSDAPNGSWTPTRLADIARIIRGRVSPQDHPLLPLIRMDNVEPHTMRLLDTVPAATMKSASVHFHPGDVLYGRLRPYLNKVVNPDFEGLASAEFIPLTMPEGVDPRFIQYRINALDFVSFASRLDEGDRPRVDYDQIGAFKLSLPPTSEQHRIVAAIECFFTRLDDAVASLERVQRNLKRYRASVLKAAVEGRLVPTEAELARAEGRGYEPASALLARILAERRHRWEQAELAKMAAKGNAPKNDKWKARYVEPAAPNASELPELPEGWCWATVDQLAAVGTGATPNRGETRFWSGGDVPWVTSAVVNQPVVSAPSEYVTHAALRETNLAMYPPGTLLVAMYGEGKTRGRATTLGIESATNQALAALELPGTADQLRGWLLCFLEHNYLELRRAASGGVQPNLNLGIVRRLCVPLPPISEQRRISEEADRSLSIAHATFAVAKSSQLKVGRLRQSILKWAFEGRLVDQDPSDEAASVLLERIRAERATASYTPPRSARRPRAKVPKP